MKKNIVTTFLAVLFGIHIATAYATDIDELTTLLSSFQTYKANFSQQTFDQRGEKLQQLTGVMVLQKPDHFYWESDEPYAQKLISNGKTIWHYDNDLEQVVIQEYAKQAAQAPVLVILRDPASLAKSFRIAHVNRKNNKVQFQLEALEKNATLKEVELGFSNGILSQLGFIDSLQQKTSIDFSAPALNEKTETSRFEFILPEGVDVLYE